MNEFTPRFSHLAFLLIAGIVFAVIAAFLPTGMLRTVLFFASGLMIIVGLIWLSMLKAERVHTYKQWEQTTERENLLAVSRLAESLSTLPPGAMLQALDRAMPGLDFASIVIDSQPVQFHTGDNFDIQKSFPADIATAAQYHLLAVGYLDKGRGLSYNFWTQTQPGQARPFFGRVQFEKLLSRLVADELADKDYVTGEVTLTDDGIECLRRYLPPPPDGLTPINPRTRTQNTT